MEKSKIIEILEDWNFWNKEHKTGIERREYLTQLSNISKTKQIIAITGVRRSGKSTIMSQFIKQLIKKGIKPKNILYVNFEDLRFEDFTLESLNKIYEVYLEYLNPDSEQYIFLDEIHKIENWERFARTMHELKKAQVFVSGSNAKLLSGKISSVLTGRHLNLKVFPLSFKEFLDFKGIKIENNLEIISQRHRIKFFLKEYLEHGGFPLVSLQEQKKEILETYFEDIINKDIVENYRIENISKIKSLAKFYLTNIGRRISFNSLSKSLGLSLDTIERYSYYLEEVFLIYLIKKFSYSVKEQEKTMAVVYSIDNGLRNIVSFKFSKDSGWLYQNVVAERLIRDYGKENLFYWMNSLKEEVDFVIREKQKTKQLIQVCYTFEEQETKKREIRALLKASKELKCKNLLIITDDYEKSEKIKNKTIKFIPLWKWLLS